MPPWHRGAPENGPVSACSYTKMSSGARVEPKSIKSAYYSRFPSLNRKAAAGALLNRDGGDGQVPPLLNVGWQGTSPHRLSPRRTERVRARGECLGGLFSPQKRGR